MGKSTITANTKETTTAAIRKIISVLEDIAKAPPETLAAVIDPNIKHGRYYGTSIVIDINGGHEWTRGK